MELKPNTSHSISSPERKTGQSMSLDRMVCWALFALIWGFGFFFTAFGSGAGQSRDYLIGLVVRGSLVGLLSLIPFFLSFVIRSSIWLFRPVDSNPSSLRTEASGERQTDPQVERRSVWMFVAIPWFFLILFLMATFTEGPEGFAAPVLLILVIVFGLPVAAAYFLVPFLVAVLRKLLRKR